MTCPRSNTTLLLWPWKLLVRSILSCTYSQFPFWNGLASSFQTETFFLLLCKWAGDEERKPHPLPLMAGSLKCFWLPWNIPLSSFWIGQLSQRKVELAGPRLQVNILRMVSWRQEGGGNSPGLYLQSGGWGKALVCCLSYVSVAPFPICLLVRDLSSS